MDDAHEMACRELVQLVSDYLDAYLTEADRQRFDEHLAVCSGCVTIVEQFRATIAMTGATNVDREISPATRDRLLAAFRDWTEAPSES